MQSPLSHDNSSVTFMSGQVIDIHEPGEGVVPHRVADAAINEILITWALR